MPPAPDILCIGAVLWDVIGRTDLKMALGDDVPGRISRLPGGVALNIAVTLAGLGLRPAILTCIGQDLEGDALIAACTAAGLISDFAYRAPDLPTDRYMAIEGANGLIAAVADAHSLERAGARILEPMSDGRLGPWTGAVALDGNLTTDLLKIIADSPLFAQADLRVAPASPGKAERLLALVGHPSAAFYVNLAEAGLICGTVFPSADVAARALLAKGVAKVLVTDGPRQAAVGQVGVLMTAMPPEVTVARVTGAGDTFLAAHIVAEIAGADPATALILALDAAATFVSGKTPR
jgi:pseudouridine kinase